MTDLVIEYLNGRDGASEAAKITQYRVFIHNREVDVTVKDHGEAAANQRFSVEACWADIPAEDRQGGNPGYTLGNPEATLREALHGPHWWIFRPSDD